MPPGVSVALGLALRSFRTPWHYNITRSPVLNHITLKFPLGAQVIS